MQFINCFFHSFCCWYWNLKKKKKNHCHAQGHLGIILCYLLAGFIVLCFTFKSMIHFHLINMKDVRSSWMLMSTFSSTICWKDCLCFIVLSLLSYQRSVHYLYMGLLLDYLCPIMFSWIFSCWYHTILIM